MDIVLCVLFLRDRHSACARRECWSTLSVFLLCMACECLRVCWRVCVCFVTNSVCATCFCVRCLLLRACYARRCVYVCACVCLVFSVLLVSTKCCLLYCAHQCACVCAFSCVCVLVLLHICGVCTTTPTHYTYVYNIGVNMDALHAYTPQHHYMHSIT